MKKFLLAVLVVLFVVSLAGISSATNGDNLIGIGPVNRSMGGVGIASPQDAISAVFANPAAMCFGPYCPGTEVNFAGTLFMPKVSASVANYSGVISADSDKKVYAIPAFGLSVPISTSFPLMRFGLAAYGVSGLGVDYRDTAISNNGSLGQAPLVAGDYTQLQIMKFSPSFAYAPNEKLSLGIGLQVDYASLDLKQGNSFNYGVGLQLGVVYKILDGLNVGATYVTPQEINHKNVADFDHDGTADDLKLESPQQIGLGISVEPVKDSLLIATDVKWINWADAKGYKDFDWDNQWVFGVGMQYKPIKQLAFRVGYNYGKSPVKSHNGFDGSFNQQGMPNSTHTVQGHTMPTYYYETFRIVGFPAVVENHITAGVGLDLSKSFAMHLGYMHAFKNSVSEDGTDPTGQHVGLESKLSEDAVDLGFTFRF